MEQPWSRLGVKPLGAWTRGICTASPTSGCEGSGAKCWWSSNGIIDQFRIPIPNTAAHLHNGECYIVDMRSRLEFVGQWRYQEGRPQTAWAAAALVCPASFGSRSCGCCSVCRYTGEQFVAYYVAVLHDSFQINHVVSHQLLVQLRAGAMQINCLQTPAPRDCRQSC